MKRKGKYLQRVNDQPDSSPAIEARQHTVWGLRESGMSVRDIAVKLNVSMPTVYADLDYVSRLLEQQNQDPLVVARNVELAKLDVLEQEIINSSPAGHLAAINLRLKISERRAKLLGLDKRQTSINVNVDVSSLSDEELQLLVEQTN